VGRLFSAVWHFSERVAWKCDLGLNKATRWNLMEYRAQVIARVVTGETTRDPKYLISNQMTLAIIIHSARYIFVRRVIHLARVVRRVWICLSLSPAHTFIIFILVRPAEHQGLHCTSREQVFAHANPSFFTPQLWPKNDFHVLENQILKELTSFNYRNLSIAG
jgi:hypothetical protein